MNRNPEFIITITFLFAILTGTILLKLPWATHHGLLSWIDAAFMATSAVCVTGLSVVDLGRDFTFFGQVVILCLIQVGGLGIMTFSLLLFLVLGMRVSFGDRLTVANLSQKLDLAYMKRALSLIFIMTFTIEMIGTGLLFIRIRETCPADQAFFLSLFHSVAAFCNAGLSLYSDNLMRFQNEVYVPCVIMGLIILGGLGFIVIAQVFEKLRNLQAGKKIHLNLYAKISLHTTALLIIFGAAIIWLIEHNNVLSGQPLINQVTNALFLSVTSRTAGFNTVEVSLMANATLFFVAMLMFIGGCPGSTAGGIKVTVFAVLFAYMRSNMRGTSLVSLFRRKIPDAAIQKSLTVFFLSFFTIGYAVLLLALTETVAQAKGVPQENFLDLFFESISAFGTVGLSTGITPHLSNLGKGIIILLMFVGRIGPLTLGFALQNLQKKDIPFEYPQEEVIVT